MPAHAHQENVDTIAALKAGPYPAVDEVKPADVVMKGGITSGVVYPLAVCELAKHYRFCNVGGSSAGGIAAAFAAAAEHARERGGFKRLAELPELLGGDMPKLFQPSRATRASFDLFRTATSGRRSGVRKAGRLFAVLMYRQWAGALAGGAVAASATVWSLMLARGAPHSQHGWWLLLRDAWPALPLVLLAAVAGAVAASALSAFRALPRNGHGLCIGSNGTGQPTNPKPFTDWMDEQLSYVADVAGVLTFGDLWGRDEKGALLKHPAVRLEMMTTNVTQARPVRLPFTEDVYMFCPVELSRWFPPRVMTVLGARGHALRDDGTPWCCPEHDTPLHKLPKVGDLPVVVAVRMTLSFPLLISAVPLWVVDYGAKQHVPVHCRFSDGGISSNFPIHFFDSLLPSRPTFAISLAPYPKGYEKQHVRYTADPKVHRATPTDSVGGFFGAILDTLQNWSDNGQSMLPGYRDRIVEVRIAPNEGGMNLDMDERTILDLAVRGRDAALALLDREHGGFDFEAHRVRRYRIAVAELQEALATMGTRWDAGYRGLVAARTGTPACGVNAAKRVDSLLAFVGRQPDATYVKASPDLTRDRLRPDPDLRIVPRF
jgi:hypothetical protein